MNKVIIGKEWLERYLIKDSLFDIFRLVNQLYRSKSTVLEGTKPGKVYFSDNPAPDLILDGMKVSSAQIKVFNILLKSNRPVVLQDRDADKDTTGKRYHLIKVLDDGTNKTINDLFISARELAHVTLDLANIFL